MVEPNVKKSFFLQVALPSLHISLGTYLKFFNLLEDHCDILDMKILAELELKNKTCQNIDIAANIKKLREIKELEFQAQDLHEKICLVQEAIKMQMLKGEKTETEIRAVFEPRIEFFQTLLNTKV